MRNARTLRLLLSVLAISLASVATHGGPSSKIGTARLITPNDANAYYGSVSLPDYSLPGGPYSSPAGPRAPELVELARALSQNVDQIYDFVRNNIEITFSQGLQKGALGTLIDRHGTAFDQAHLMVELLRQSGYTASYRYGTITLDAAQFSTWTGISTARAACELLSSGGIPALINGSGSSILCSSFAADTPITSVALSHVWVAVVIGGTTHLFDPAYKPHTPTSGVDLRAATGLSAGQPVASATSGMISGSQSGVGFVRNLNAESLNTTLQTYGTNLLSHINTHQAASSIESILAIGEISRQIVPATGLRQAALPYPASVSATWTGNIPGAYRTTLRIEISKQVYEPPDGTPRITIIDKTVYVDEVYGRKLLLDPNFPTGDQNQVGSFTANLRLTDRWGFGPAIATYTRAIDQGFRRSGSVKLTANHPYPADAGGGTAVTGTYMDGSTDKPVTMLEPLVVLHGWGHSGEGLLQAWGSRPDRAAPEIPFDEFGCDACNRYFFASRGDGRREQLGAAWLAQSSRAAQLHAAIAKSAYTHHHSLGVVSADTWAPGVDLIPTAASTIYYVVTDSFDRLDVDSAFSVTSKTSNVDDRRAAIHAIAATSDALEGAVVAQIADLPDTASTATRFEWGNRPPAAEDLSGGYGSRRFYRYSASTTAQAATLTIGEGVTSTSNDGIRTNGLSSEPELGNNELQTRRTVVANAVNEYATAGFDVIAVEDAFLGPGQRGGVARRIEPSQYANAPSQQRAGAAVATRYVSGDPVEIAHIVIGHDEYSKGGGGGVQSDHQAQYDPAKAADILKARFVDRSKVLGVDLTSGALSYVAPAQLTIGNGGFPYELSAQLIWRGGDRVETRFGPIMHTQPQVPWTTNWHNNLTVSSSALEAMGQTDARAAAATVAAFLAQQDIYRSAAIAEREVSAVLVGSWWLRQLSGNAVTVSVGADTRQFIRDVSGQWFVPGGGAYATLTQTGTRTPFMQACTATGWTHARGWNYAGVSFVVTNTSGDTQTFAFWENDYHSDATASTCAKQRGFRMTNWIFPQGVTINLVYQPPPGVGQLDRLVEVNNSLGRRIRFNYESGENAPLSSLDNGLSGADFRSISMGLGLPFLNSVTDPSGAQTRFTISLTNGEYRLEEVYDANDTSIPSLRYTYDALNRVKEARDAVALQIGGRNPYQFFIADGVRGERLDPAGGRYTVFYDLKKRPFGFMDELGRTTAAEYDGRGRLTRYIYPEGDKEELEYDARNNVTKLIEVGKPCSPQPCTTPTITTQADWHATWNKPNWVRDGKGYQTDFEYYPSGNGRSLLQTATRPGSRRHDTAAGLQLHLQQPRAAPRCHGPDWAIDAPRLLPDYRESGLDFH